MFIGLFIGYSVYYIHLQKPVEAKMSKEMLYKLFIEVDPAKVVLAVQLLILAAFVFGVLASHGVALAGFADGGMGGGGPKATGVEFLR
jgi:hypothetical protein